MTILDRLDMTGAQGAPELANTSASMQQQERTMVGARGQRTKFKDKFSPSVGNSRNEDPYASFGDEDDGMGGVADWADSAGMGCDTELFDAMSAIEVRAQVVLLHSIGCS